ncbi:MAG: HEAT repeat domain-containing protein, partial [Segetibacter sp.]
KMARVAPSGLMRYRGSAFGKEYSGNLFSAEFNTGRIIRHRITAEGATYRTVDEPFINSTSPDIHLTDVLEDADGSMLVLNTGGWFITGCPLSRVAKLDVHGGIYRIRKNGLKKVDDAWGHQLNLASFSPQSLTKLMNDPRHAVRDKVIERLVEIGEPAVVSIKKVLLTSVNEEIRSAAVFALCRINTPGAWREVLRSLNDPSVLVRIAAARVLGLAKNKEAVNKLMEIVQKDKSPVRRQAATALGQIGDDRAVNALLNGVVTNSDRFAEHAIIYALINLKNSAPLFAALTHSSSNVRKAAVIALDQMDGFPLRKENLLPFLASKDPQLRNTGIWVASHHAEWADLVINFLQNRLSIADLSGTNASSVHDLIIKFSDNKQLQNIIAGQLANAANPAARKAFLLDVINHSPVKEIPVIWVEQLGKLLQEGDAEIQLLVLKLIESRSIRALNDPLKQIVQNPNTPAGFRLTALTSSLISNPGLSEKEFTMVLRYLEKINESPIRQSAALVLATATLSNVQLLKLAKEQVAQTDVFLLPSLVTAFEGSSDKEVGEALITALSNSANRLDNFSEQDLKKLFSKYPQSVEKSAESLMVTLRERNAARLTQLQSLEAQIKRGDVGQGRKLYFGKAICSSCHAIGAQGGTFGPDLTNIGQIRSRHDILEAILFPGASFAREHETSRVITKTSSYTGIIKQQLPEALIVSIAPGQNIRVQRKEIIGIEPQSISMMPPGLDKQLSREELSDLLAYLTSLPDGMGGHGNEH